MLDEKFDRFKLKKSSIIRLKNSAKTGSACNKKAQPKVLP
jgi:hypothetical protein